MEAIFFIGFVVLITSILIGILNYVDRKELNYEIGFDTDRFIYNGKLVWSCTGRDHFDRDGYVWHYNGDICGRWSKIR